MPSQKVSLLSPTELAYIYSSLRLNPPIRPDARSPTTFRPLVAEIDLVPSANGSARLCFADGTEGIVGVKAEVERTGPIRTTQARDPEDGQVIAAAGVKSSSNDANDQGISGHSRWVEVTIELPNQKEEDPTVVFLAQIIHEGLVADGMLPDRLYINLNWHWKLYVDILLLSPPSSYPLPLISLSTHLALLSTQLPALISREEEDPHFDDDWDAAVPLYPKLSRKKPDSIADHCPKPPMSIMVASVGSNLFFDPSREELTVADAVIVVTVAAQAESDMGAEVLGIRTLDPPAALTTSSSAALGGEPGFGKVDDGEGIWKPKRGGINRDAIARTIDLCSKKGGVGEEVLQALEGFL